MHQADGNIVYDNRHQKFLSLYSDYGALIYGILQKCNLEEGTTVVVLTDTFAKLISVEEQAIDKSAVLKQTFRSMASILGSQVALGIFKDLKAANCSMWQEEAYCRSMEAS